MAIGVTYDEFWHGEPEIVRYAIEAEEARHRDRAIHDDFVAWNTGRYVMLGTGVIMSHAFAKHSTAEYPKEPLIGPELDEALAEQKRERELLQMHANFLARASLQHGVSRSDG